MCPGDNDRQELDFEHLRQRAVERLQGKRPQVSSMTSEDIDSLVHELEIQQAELVVQNEELLRVQAELARARDRYLDLYEFAPVGYLMLDAEGIIRQANLAATAILHEERQSLLGKRLEKFLAREDRDACYILLRNAALSSGNREVSELRLACAGQSRRWVMAEVAFQPAAGDQTASFRVTLSEITARKQAEQTLRDSENRFRTMSDGLPLLVWVHDAEGNQQFVNRTFAEFFGVPADQFRGDGWQRLLHPEDAEVYIQKFLICVQARRPFHASARVMAADGQWRWIESWGTPQFSDSGEFLGFVGASADITVRRQTEQKLHELKKNLEQRVAERTQELERKSHQLRHLMGELSDAEVRERQKLADLLHDDLQQTLVGAKMQLEMGADIIPDKSKALDHLSKAAGYLDEAIAGARGLSHELSPATLRMKGLIAGIRWLGEQIAAKHELRVDVRTTGTDQRVPEPIKNMVYKAVRELLFNVVKHAGVEEAKVDIRCSDHELEVRVEDHGQGFDPAEAFGSDKASGLGLSSIRERLMMLDGQLEAVSTPGQGSRFRITFPLPAADVQEHGDEPEHEHEQADDPRQATFEWHGDDAEPKRKRPRRVRAPSDRTRILLVDDHHVFRQGLSILLNNESDMEVVAEAANGREGVEAADRCEPDVVLMDMTMPDMAGDEATRRIKQEFPHIRVIGLSMHEERDAAQQMLDAGAESYIPKAGPPYDLLTVIRQPAPAPAEQ